MESPSAVLLYLCKITSGQCVRKHEILLKVPIIFVFLGDLKLKQKKGYVQVLEKWPEGVHLICVVGFSIQTDLIKCVGSELVQGLFGMFSLSLSGSEFVSSSRKIIRPICTSSGKIICFPILFVMGILKTGLFRVSISV